MSTSKPDRTLCQAGECPHLPFLPKVSALTDHVLCRTPASLAPPCHPAEPKGVLGVIYNVHEAGRDVIETHVEDSFKLVADVSGGVASCTSTSHDMLLWHMHCDPEQCRQP